MPSDSTMHTVFRQMGWLDGKIFWLYPTSPKPYLQKYETPAIKPELPLTVTLTSNNPSSNFQNVVG